MGTAVQDVIAEACYENDMHGHNDPPLWDGPPGVTINDREKRQYYADAYHILKRLERAGIEFQKS